MIVTYYIKLFRMGADRHNGMLMSLLLLVAETLSAPILTETNPNQEGLEILQIYFLSRVTQSKSSRCFHVIF